MSLPMKEALTSEESSSSLNQQELNQLENTHIDFALCPFKQVLISVHSSYGLPYVAFDVYHT